jgi:hypothetical protein
MVTLFVAVLLNVPLTLITDVPAALNVSMPLVGVEIFQFKHAAVAPTVIVAAAALDVLLKNTLSAAVGADAPPAPPAVALQLAVFAASHVPAPFTQCLSAMFKTQKL